MWSAAQIAPLDPDALRALRDAEIPAIRIPGFATPAECESLAGALLDRSVRTHSVQEVTRLGISQYAQGIVESKEGYFRLADELKPEFDEIFARSFSPTDRMLELLRAHGIDADVMTEPGVGHYWAGSGKLRNGVSPMHVDFAPQDSPGWAVEHTVAQLAWNVYLRVPGPGALQVWNRVWQPSDDVHQAEAQYYYDPVVVGDAAVAEVEPVVGEVLLLNSRLFHAVADTTDRLTFGSFISVFDDGKYRLWI